MARNQRDESPGNANTVISNEEGSSGGQFIGEHISSTPAAFDAVASLVGRGNNNANTTLTYATVNCVVGGTTAGSEEGVIVFQLQDGTGSLANSLLIGQDNVKASIDNIGTGYLELSGDNDGIKLNDFVFFTDESRADAGAIPLTETIVRVSTTGAAAVTLADGTHGQLLMLVFTNDGGDATITPSNFLNGTTLTMNDAGDSAILVFLTSQGWCLVSNNGCTVA
jgi:hypothetical protein|tara:strand:+ start:115 stop:786 length:672 start_codon:yes stop_codon:yes gene_type:complete